MPKQYTIAKPVDLRLVRKRQTWLKKKKMSIRTFSESLGQDYNTVVRWFNLGRTPMRPYLKAVLSKYPDYPVKEIL